MDDEYIADSRHAQRADRAQQFMPFAALKGFYELIEAQDRKVETLHGTPTAEKGFEDDEVLVVGDALEDLLMVESGEDAGLSAKHFSSADS